MFINGSEVDIELLNGYKTGLSVVLLGDSIPSRNSENKFHLEKTAAMAFNNMHADAAIEGIELQVNSAFRTNVQQKQLYRRKGGDFAALPGYSNHQLGKAVDIANTEKKLKTTKHQKTKDLKKYCRLDSNDWKCPTITYWWLYQNAKKYGFIQTIEHEKWHWVYDEQTYQTYNSF